MSRCEVCENGNLKKKRLKKYDYQAPFGHVQITGQIVFMECDFCKDISIPAKTLKSWNQEILSHLVAKKNLLTSDELQFIFPLLPFSQSEIAFATGKERGTLIKYKNGESPIDLLFDHVIREIVEDHLKNKGDTFKRLCERQKPQNKSRPLTKIRAA